MATSLSLSITQNSRNVNNNTSNVTVKATLSWTYGSNNRTGECYGSLVIDGTTYSFTNIVFNNNQTTTGSQVVMTKTVDISHNSDGSKTLACSASFYTGLSGSGTKTALASKALTAIPRRSSLSASNGTLGTSLTLTVSRASSSFTHTITYKCGSASGTIVTKSSSTSIAWNTSNGNTVALASQNTTGKTVSVTFTITTYNGSTSLGSGTKTVTMTIPSSVKPSCSISVTDTTGYETTYGNPIKGLSKLKVKVTPTVAQGSPIASYNVSVGSTKYLASEFTTGVINTSGALAIKATVTDKRGYSSDSATVSKTVIDYTEPVVIKLTVKRCDQNGTEDDQGAYVQVKFSAKISSLNSKNTASYTLKYKKSSESSYTEVALTDYSNIYIVTDGTSIFPADSGSSYDIVLYATDKFGSANRYTSASTAFTLMHWKADGTGMAIGKIAEESNLFDVDLDSRFIGSVYGNVFGLNKLPTIASDSDLNNYLTTGCWCVVSNAAAATIANIPIARAGRLEVSSSTGEGIRVSEWSYLRQRYIPYNMENATWERDITRNTTNVWTYGPWYRTSLSSAVSESVYHIQKILWEGAKYMTNYHTAVLSEKVSDQPNGIVLVFSKYSNGEAQDNNYNMFFVPRVFVTTKNGYGCGFTMMDTNFGQVCHKYLYVNDAQITGHERNNATGAGTSGITYANNAYVMRYVIGV